MSAKEAAVVPTRIELTPHPNGRHWMVHAVGHPERAFFLEWLGALEHAIERSRKLSPAVLMVWNRAGRMVRTVQCGPQHRVNTVAVQVALKDELSDERDEENAAVRPMLERA
jgi:hypothetical protein